MTIDEVKTQIETALPGCKLKKVRETLLVEDPKDLTAIAEFLKYSDFELDYLSSVTGADYLQYLEAVYHFYSMEKKIGPLVLRVRVPRENPKIPSLTPIFRGAEYQEREVYDMFGIVYEGHPDPRRIFMWDNFSGFPLRKDYEQEDSETLETADIEWLEKNGVKVPKEMSDRAEELRKQGKRALAQKPGPEQP